MMDKSTMIFCFNKFCNKSLTITPRYGKIICPVIFLQIIMVSPYP